MWVGASQGSNGITRKSKDIRTVGGGRRQARYVEVAEPARRTV